MPLPILSKEKILKKLHERSCLKCNGSMIPESVNTEEDLFPENKEKETTNTIGGPEINSPDPTERTPPGPQEKTGE